MRNEPAVMAGQEHPDAQWAREVPREELARELLLLRDSPGAYTVSRRDALLAEASWRIRPSAAAAAAIDSRR